MTLKCGQPRAVEFICYLFNTCCGVARPRGRPAPRDPELMADKRRRVTSEGQSEAQGWLASLDRVEQIQEDLEDINDEVATRVLQIVSCTPDRVRSACSARAHTTHARVTQEREANTQRTPLYEQRKAAIASVPGFWPGALTGHPLLVEYMTDRDQEIFEHLVQLTVHQEDDVKSGYRISLAFRPNPYFSDAELTKTLKYADDGELTMSASTVHWKDGQQPVSSPGGRGGAAGAQRHKRGYDQIDQPDGYPVFLQVRER